MSYCSRVYRQRNAHTNDEAEKQPFFSKQHDVNKSNQRSAFFQPKLSVNAPGDVYEREADSVANSVVNHSANTPVVQQKKISAVQQMSNADEKKDKLKGVQKMDKPKEEEKKKKPVQQMSNTDEKKDKLKGVQKMDKPKEEEKKKPVQQMSNADEKKDKLKGVQKMDKPKEEEKKMPVQTKQEAGGTTATPQVTSAIEQSSGKGNALSKNTLNEMNSSFGVDFSNVRIHNDNEAAAINQELNAQAFTHGNDIYFNKGKYNPENAQGKFLLAHELTHVVQQGAVDESLVQKSPAVAVAIGAGVAAAILCAYAFYDYALNNFPDKSDKWKHCYVSCKITSYCGGDAVALIVGAGKEGLDAICDAYGKGCEAEFMDFVADLEGIGCSHVPFLPCTTCCDNIAPNA